MDRTIPGNEQEGHRHGDDGSDSANGSHDWESQVRLLESLTRRVTAALTGGADAGFKEYATATGHVGTCWGLLRATAEEAARGPEVGRRRREVCVSAVERWRGCVADVLDALRTALGATYRSYDPDAADEVLGSLFADVEFRAAAIQQMRKAKIGRAMPPDFSRARYDVRFRNHDRVRAELRELEAVVAAGGRDVVEYDVSPRGDAVLEFEGPRCVRRYRVVSWVLAETSPVFARRVADEGGECETRVWRDGSEVKVYRMPQVEEDREDALRILLHAAHMHNDKIPREVSFERFVAVAEVCLRYECTSPLEVVVEHRWLPAWIHKGSEEMPDGMLLISYAFGLRQLFTRMSKTAVMNVRDEEELRGKPWPPGLKDKVWALRTAKMEQVLACCEDVVRGYMRGPSRVVEDARAKGMDVGKRGVTESGGRGEISRPTLVLSSTPRCPRGDHSCDATNLGWLMMILGELQLLSTVVRDGVIGHLGTEMPRRSLAELVELLRTMPSPPQGLHRGGVCDPAPVFRAAVSDVYNSVSGLTLYDVSGAHGWGLSKQRSGEPQLVLRKGYKAEERKRVEAGDDVRLEILKGVNEVEEMRKAASVDKGFSRVFKENEDALVGRFMKTHRRKTLTKLTSVDLGQGPKIDGNVEGRPWDSGSSGEAPDENFEDNPGIGGVGDQGTVGDSVDPREENTSRMDDEEDGHILSPESPRRRSQSHEPHASTLATKEKFRRSDPAFVEGKMLLEVEGKQLRIERDRRVGLVRDGG
ncbi:hypothetical protein C8035_v008336 [Colletotrichum spinosum]|uniref:BTB domain-containing protein n=1 Tax=Colletotrichum spinosum TaxID=1347390 RepID=A0A4R8QE12_9PEZI|nr:hypothetical protein C8035_v008336 [Colletotrichum spinosum]